MNAVEQLDYAIWPMLHRMTTVGLRVDQAALDALQRRAVARMAEVLGELELLVGHPVNPNSGDQVAEWMESEGFVGKLTRGKDRLSTSERDLKLHVSPVIDLVLEYRGLQKIVSTYIEPIRGYSRWDGRLHPRWKPTRVPSGRLACGRERPQKTLSQWDSPNLMAFPNRDEWGLALIRCLIADPGYTMFSIDYSQIEMRNIAALSQDPGLLRIYRESRDIYAETAGSLFGIPIPDDWKNDSAWQKAYRMPAKIVTLAIPYGTGDRTVFEELLKWGCGTPSAPRFTEEDCGSLRARWFATYLGVQTLTRKVCNDARDAGGWATTELGRRRFLPGLLYSGRRYPQSKLRDESERMAFNHLIQGTSQEDCKRGLVRIWARAERGEFDPQLQIHDEVVGQTRNPSIVAELAETMVTERGGVMLKTAWATGETWADLQ